MQNNENPILEEQKEDYVLEIKNLKMYFDITTGFFKTTPLKAVDGVSFNIKRGETLGVVGESGCGKTTLGRTIMNLYRASSGDVIFEGQSISSYSDLNKILVEKKFELKNLKYEFDKSVREYKKEEPDKVSVDNFINEHKPAYLEKREALIKEYDEKYLVKQKEIEDAINKVLKDKEEKLAALEVVLKESDLPAIAEADKKSAEYKEAANKKISIIKEQRKKKYEEAAKQYKADLADYKLFVLEHTSEEEAIKAKLKEVANKDDKAVLDKELKRMIKDHKNDEIVRHDKVKNDYAILRSQALSEYQTNYDKIKDEMNSKISEARSQSKYYSYVDMVNKINNEANDEIKKIKSSSKIRLKNFRKNTTMVFQDPYSSLNPRMTVQDIIAEPLDVNKLYRTKEERRTKVIELMRKVGLSPEHSTRYAHEFSGGQRQRIGIARSLAVNPSFVICDEPVSALDVSIQAQVINTFKDLQNELGLTYLFIAHDLLVVRHISDRIAVMYLGKVVELAETKELFDNPLHPYTKSLLSAVPMPDPNTARANQRIILEGDVPSPLNVPSGCPFRTRCPKACERCKTEVPALKEISKGHFASCILLEDENN